MAQIFNSAMASALSKSGLAPAASTNHQDARPTCQYCGNEAELVTGKEIYPTYTHLHHRRFWSCTPCAAYVGCHEANKGQGDGTRPLGILANAELRAAKSAMHQAFDPLWKEGVMSRTEAYQWLASELGIPLAECHIGMFGLEMCQRAETICEGKDLYA